MDETKLLTELSLPKSTWFLRNLPFNQLSQRLNAKQKKLCSDFIQSYGIRVLATIKSANSNIPSFEDDTYKYEEVHIYTIELKEWKKQKEIFQIFSQIIPYPLLILFYQDENYQWVAAKYHRHTDRVNLVVDYAYQSNDDILIEDYYEALNFEKLNKTNLKALYESILSALINVELRDSYEIETDINKNEELLERLKAIDSEINKLYKMSQKETQMNHRVKLNMEIHQLKQDKEKILKETNNDQ